MGGAAVPRAYTSKLVSSDLFCSRQAVTAFIAPQVTSLSANTVPREAATMVLFRFFNLSSYKRSPKGNFSQALTFGRSPTQQATAIFFSRMRFDRWLS
jgi:hypothetical protein